MGVTDTTQVPETIVCDWRAQMRGAAYNENPLDIMFDIDDVLFPTMWSIHDLARGHGLHDGSVTPTWSGWEVYRLPDGQPCPPEVYWDLWSEFAASGGYVDTPPIDEAIRAVRELYLDGHRIHLVTARGFMAHADDIRRWTQEWRDEWAVPWHTLTFAQDKVAAQIDVFYASPNPVNPCKRTFDYALDDSPKNFQALWEAGVEAYLLDHVHNADWVWPKAAGAHRVASVSEFAEIINASMSKRRTA